MQLSLTHAGAGYVNFTAEGLIEAGVPAAAVDAAVAAQLVALYEARIDAAGDRLSVSSSRAARYIQKAAEAQAYAAAGRPASVSVSDYPILVAESAARGVTKGELTDMILAREAAFYSLMGAAEAARVSIGAAIGGVADEAARREAAEAIVRPFEAAVDAALAA